MTSPVNQTQPKTTPFVKEVGGGTPSLTGDRSQKKKLNVMAGVVALVAIASIVGTALYLGTPVDGTPGISAKVEVGKAMEMWKQNLKKPVFYGFDFPTCKDQCCAVAFGDAGGNEAIGYLFSGAGNCLQALQAFSEDGIKMEKFLVKSHWW